MKSDNNIKLSIELPNIKNNNFIEERDIEKALNVSKIENKTLNPSEIEKPASWCDTYDNKHAIMEFIRNYGLFFTLGFGFLLFVLYVLYLFLSWFILNIIK